MIGKLLNNAWSGFSLARDGERGVSLLETLVALSIVGAVAAVFLAGLSTSSKAVIVSQERVNAESLAKSQMEYVKAQAYDAENNPPQYDKLPDEDIPAGYDIVNTAVRLDPKEEGDGADYSIQEVTVEIYRGEGEDSKLLLTLVGYKLNR